MDLEKIFNEMDYHKKCLLVGRVAKMYYDKNMSLNEIAEKLKIDSGMVHYVLGIIVSAREPESIVKED